jgi:hypothetical protein
MSGVFAFFEVLSPEVNAKNPKKLLRYSGRYSASFAIRIYLAKF